MHIVGGGNINMNVLRWLQGLFRRSPRVELHGQGYQVDGQFCSTQTEVRRRLEQLGVTEPEIVDILKRQSIEKYGDAHR